MKTIIFDFDGVIHDTFDIALKINTKVLGKKLTKEEYKDYFNGNIYDQPDITKDTYDKFFRLNNEAFKFLKIEEKIKGILERLSKDFPLFIISSNSEKTLDLYFRNNNFTHIFKEVLGFETHKSKVDKFKYLFRKYDLNPEDCVFITDTLGDILEANKVNVKTMAVDYGFHDRDRLEKGNPYKIVSSFDELDEELSKLIISQPIIKK